MLEHFREIFMICIKQYWQLVLISFNLKFLLSTEKKKFLSGKWKVNSNFLNRLSALFCDSAISETIQLAWES